MACTGTRNKLATLLILSKRCFHATAFLSRTRGNSKIPWDKRFPVNAKDVAPTKKGGSRQMLAALPHTSKPHPTGYTDPQTKRFVTVNEMIPEFVVPDLTGFELKPYVSYKVKEINQNKLTPRVLFNAVYAKKFEEDYQKGNICVEGEKVILEDGTKIDMSTGLKES